MKFNLFEKIMLGLIILAFITFLVLIFHKSESPENICYSNGLYPYYFQNIDGSLKLNYCVDRNRQFYWINNNHLEKVNG